MIRSIVAVFVGFIVASVVMMTVETINGKILYPELGKQGAEVRDMEGMKKLMANAPVGALVVVLFGWVLGSIAGSWVTTLIKRKPPAVHALILGGFLTLAGIVNNLMMPPPLWFWVATFCIFLPATYLGSKLVRQPVPAVS